MANRIQLRRGNTSEWTNANPILAQGEVGIDLDQNRIKIGDGSTPWNSLAYERPDDQSSNIGNTLVKRDANGNFSANAITAALVGNASTASQLANSRQISLTGDVNGANSFDGSQNVTITATLATQANVSAGTYTKLTVNERGLVTAVQNPTTLAGYNITDGQLENNFLTALSGLHAQSLNGYVVKTNNTTTGSVVRQIIGTAGRIQQTGDSTGITGNTIFDLIPTGVSQPYGGTNLWFDVGNTQQTKIFNAPTQESNTSTNKSLRMTVDVWGRLTEITEFPIVTSYEGTISGAFNNSTNYNRYDRVTAGGRLYEAGYGGVASGGGAPSHTDGTKTGGWWDLGVAKTPVKGLASFSQEDFDVDSNGHVTIASRGIDNTQLQNNKIAFGDGFNYEEFELDNELNETTAYNGFNYLNYIGIQDLSGNPIFGASQGGLASTYDHYFFNDLLFQETDGQEQRIHKTTDGDLRIFLDINSSNNRSLLLTTQNAGTGTTDLVLGSVDGGVYISGSGSGAINTSDAGVVEIENVGFQGNVIYGTPGQSELTIKPEYNTNSGTLVVEGNLTVQGTTVTVNSTTVTIDDPIFSLSDQPLSVNDGKDRGIEFSYYSGSSKKGFFGWDNSSSKYRFLDSATNTSEIFTGTDSGLLAGNLTLSSNIPSSSTTTGTLVITGGAGISEDLYLGQDAYIGDVLDVTGATILRSTLSVLNDLSINTNKFTVASSSGNTVIAGTLNVNSAVDLDTTLNVDGNADFKSNVTITNANSNFTVENSSGVDAFRTNSSTGNTYIKGTLNTVGAVDFDSTLNVDGSATFQSDVIINADNSLFAIQNNVGSTKFLVDTDNGNTDIQGTLDVLGNVAINTNKFNITAASGNTSIAGTLAVTGNTTLSGTLSVTNNTTLSANLNVNGNTTLGNQSTDTVTSPGLTTFTNITSQDVTSNSYNATGAVRISGGLGVAENLAVGQDLYVYGDFNTVGDQVINGTTTYNGRFTINNSDDATSYFDNSVALKNFGGMIVNKNAWFGGDIFAYDAPNFRTTFSVDTSTGNTDIYGDLDIRAGKFYVTASTGNTSIAGTLSVAGNTEINGTLDVDADFAVRDAGNVDRFFVDNVTGNTSIAGTLDLTGTLAINSNKFVVSASTGNTSILGTLGVSGSTTLDGNLTVNGNQTLGNTSSDTLTVNSTSTFIADVSTNGNTTLGNQSTDLLAVNATSTFNANVAISGTNTLTTGTGAVTLGGNLTVNGSTLDINSTDVQIADKDIRLNAVASPTDANANGGGIILNGTSNHTFLWLDATDAWTSSEHLNLASTKEYRVNGTAVIDGNRNLVNIAAATLSGNASIGGTLGVTGATTLSNTLGVTGAATFGSTLGVTGAATFSNTLESTGTFTVNSNRFVVSASNGNTSILGTLTVGAGVTLSSTLNVQGAADLDTTLNVDGAATFNNTVTLVGGSSNLTVGGNAIISGNLTVNGTTTTVNSTVVSVDDKNIELGATASPTDAAADGGGITLKGSSDKTINWVNATGAWTFSEHIDIAASKSIYHGSTQILNSSKQLINLAGITSTGDIDFASGKFTVAGATGNTVIAGTLSVTGNLSLTGLSAVTGTFSGAVSSGGNFSVGGSNFTVASASGNTTIAGTLLAGATTLTGALGVTGGGTFSGDVAVNGGDLTTTNTGICSIFNTNAATINIGGDTTAINMGGSNSTVTMADDCDVTNNFTVGGTADFDGTTAVGNVLTVDPGAPRSVTIGTLAAPGTLTSYGNVTFGVNSSSTLTTTGSASVGTSLTVGTTGNFTGNVTAPRFISNIADGTAPFQVTSTTVVTNLNADKLDGQEGTYYRNASNINAGTLSVDRLPTIPQTSVQNLTTDLASKQDNLTNADYTSLTQAYAGSGTITIASGHSVNSVLVFLDGQLLLPTTQYTISGTTLTFTSPSAGTVHVRYLPI